MKEIDLNTWNRREHFGFFRRADLPFYNVTAPVAVTGLAQYARARGWSLNHLLVFLTVQAMNRIDNFRYRLRGERVVLHDRLHPSFAHLKPGEELFRMITLDCGDDPAHFDAHCKAAIQASQAYFDLSAFQGRDDFVFISALPWIGFTGVDHTLSLKKEDAIPRVSWGKLQAQDGQELLPYNVQVNHLFVDGLHVGRFFQTLEALAQAVQQGPLPETGPRL